MIPDFGGAGHVMFGADRPIAARPLHTGVPAGPHPEAAVGGGAVVPVLLRARGRFRPRRHPHPRAPVTASSGSSTGRRSGAPAPTTPTGRCAWPAPTGTSPSTAVSPGSPCPPRPRASRSGRSPRSTAASGFCEEFLDDVAVSVDNVIGEVNAGWTVTQTMLVYERGAGQSGGVAAASRAAWHRDMVELARRVGRIDDPAARQSIARAHINDTAQFHLGRRVFARLDAPRPSRSRRSPPTASSPRVIFAPVRAQLGLDIAGAEALYVGAGGGASRIATSTSSTADRARSPPARTR